MRTLQLYATGAATANAVAQVTIPSSSRIKAVQVSMLMDSITDGATVRLELSKIPTTQIATNGAQDPFFQIGQYGNFVTSGMAQFGVNQTFPLDVQCRQGELVFIHAVVGGTLTYFFNGILWLT